MTTKAVSESSASESGSLSWQQHVSGASGVVINGSCGCDSDAGKARERPSTSPVAVPFAEAGTWSTASAKSVRITSVPARPPPSDTCAAMKAEAG